MSICKAKDCKGQRMADSDYCGAHDEMAEDGEAFELKPPRKKLHELTMEEKAERWKAIRERERLHKRQGHPEWKELTRRVGANSVEEMAALYDGRRARDRAYRERDLGLACKATRRAAVKDAALEVLAEIKRKREERGSKLGRTA